ncbi:MAG: phosphoribosyl-AMP cyclohydrolase [Pseudomonadota bacterium]
MSFDPPGDKHALEAGDVVTPRFDAHGLIACVACDAATGEALMLAWMNAEALERTLRSGYAHFWSRSRASLWMKGETSGNRLRVLEARIDCDQDAMVLKVEVEGDGSACHTGARSCFYRRVIVDDPAGDGAPRLERIDHA